jgi:hypothetical protein
MKLFSNFTIKYEAPDYGLLLINDIDESMNNIVHKQSDELKAKDINLLKNLPRFSITRHKHNKFTYSIATWHEKKVDHHLIVTQCKRYILFSYGRIYTSGFIITSDDSIRDAENDELAEYK